MIFEKGTDHEMCVLISCTTFVWNVSHSKKNLTRYDKKNIYRSSCKVPVIHSCRILIKLKFSRLFFEKYSNIQFHENPSCGSRVVPCGRRTWRYQYSRTNEMHFLYLSTCFEHYLLVIRRRCTNNSWYIACVLCQLAATHLIGSTVLIYYNARPRRH
jgi:hypothetical protein